MSSRWQFVERRLLDLLADRATFELSKAAEQELSRLAESVPDFDDECMERAAATVQLAFASVGPLPSAIHTKLRTSGVGYVAKLSRE